MPLNYFVRIGLILGSKSNLSFRYIKNRNFFQNKSWITSHQIVPTSIMLIQDFNKKKKFKVRNQEIKAEYLTRVPNAKKGAHIRCVLGSLRPRTFSNTRNCESEGWTMKEKRRHRINGAVCRWQGCFLSFFFLSRGPLSCCEFIYKWRGGWMMGEKSRLRDV